MKNKGHLTGVSSILCVCVFITHVLQVKFHCKKKGCNVILTSSSLMLPLHKGHCISAYYEFPYSEIFVSPSIRLRSLAGIRCHSSGSYTVYIYQQNKYLIAKCNVLIVLYSFNVYSMRNRQLQRTPHCVANADKPPSL